MAMRSLTFIVWILLSVAVVFSSAAEPIGSIIAIQGEATSTGADGQGKTLALKSAIFLNDKVMTKPGAKIQILFNDDSVISQGENSEMLIDEYVFNPDKADNVNCSVSFMKGVFRVVTGKITQLNPDRFKVKTRMATIGIRGCELGFTVGQIAENIYVISFHGDESVIVHAKPNPGQGQGEIGAGEWQQLINGEFTDEEAAKRHLFNVTKPNRVISITQNVGSEERALTSAELQGLIEAVTPVADGTTDPDGAPIVGDGDTSTDDTPTDDTMTGDTTTDDTVADGTTSDGTAPDDNTMDPAVGDGTDPTTTDPVTGDTPGTTDPDTFVDTDLGMDVDTGLTDPTLVDNTGDPAPTTDPVVGSGTLPIVEDPIIYADPVTDPASDGTTVIPDVFVDPGTTTDPGTTPVTDPNATPDTSFADSGGGVDWSWDVWGDSADGPYGVDFYANSAVDIIDGTKFDDLRTGATLYNLTGAGDAAAIISDGSVTRLIQGSCNMSVQVGNSFDPTWNGTFNIGSAGNSLYFEAGGDIQNNGALTLDGLPDTYTMVVENGTPFLRNSLTSSDLNGVLVGPGGGAAPSGVVGSFDFLHSGGASSHGGFGTDLH